MSSSDNSEYEIATPYTVKRIRQFSKLHSGIPSKLAFRKLTKANETNAARASITEHRANRLKETLQIEQKKRRRGKKLNLVGEPSGRAQFFGTKEVLAAQAREAEKLELAEKEKLEKEKEKEEKAVTKAVKEALAVEEKRRKAEQQAINKQVRLEEHNQGVLDRANARKAVAAAKKEAVEAAKAAKKAKPSRIVILRVGSTILASLGSEEQVVVEEPEEEVRVVPQQTRAGRQIVLPQRLRK
ncbi:hypothetical protein NA56DRAFT_341993 [Hyaloscypha hepaticicola]|uniref:Uncharacterized protein n=1 Tax=Hyaloscypha hepaticicola TaxID=2082293 RepID=A0A2J6QJ82_9HELO|nr:hypothetical protein NA56DRAFT_341993 [Hyaloscypha hepaticicola]